MQRRVMSCTGPTLLPLERNRARVLTVAVLDTPRMRPLMMLRCQHRAQALVRHQIAGEIVELDHRRGAQQLRQQQFPAFLVVSGKCGRRAPLRRGKGRDQFAQIRLAGTHHVRPRMEHRRVGQAGPDGGGEHRRQGSRQVGIAGEAELRQQSLSAAPARPSPPRELGFSGIENSRASNTPNMPVAGSYPGRRHQAAIRAQIGLPRQTAQHRQVVVAGGIEQHRRMAGRRIGAHPVLGTRIESLPSGGAGQCPHQGRLH